MASDVVTGSPVSASVPALNGAVGALIAARVRAGQEAGMQVAAYHRGELIVDAWAGAMEPGKATTGGTLFPIFSVIKGVLAVAAHIQAERGLLDIDAPIASYWPAFAAHGKERITLRDVFAHRAGVPHMPADVDLTTVRDWGWMTSAIANLTPLHPPGAQSYYHGMTYGWIIGEAIRLTDPARRGIERFVQEEIVAPLGLNGLHISVPEALLSNVAELSGAPYPANLPDNIPLRVGIPAAVDLQAVNFNRADVRRAEIPAVGGYANARSLARLYATLACGGALGSQRLLRRETVETFVIARENSDAPDPFLGGPARLSSGGFMLGGGKPAVGPHPDTLFNIGAGGSIAWADRRNQLAVAITHNLLYGHQPPESDPQIAIGNLIRETLGLA